MLRYPCLNGAASTEKITDYTYHQAWDDDNGLSRTQEIVFQFCGEAG